jgi:hypothetical protein
MTVAAIVLAYSARGLARVEGTTMILLYLPFVIVVATRS